MQWAGAERLRSRRDSAGPVRGERTALGYVMSRSQMSAKFIGHLLTQVASDLLRKEVSRSGKPSLRHLPAPFRQTGVGSQW
jgi:hypothetical protein